jgi:hypothetical protein
MGCGLELQDPPRSVQSLMNKLSEVTDFEIAITGHSVNALQWAEDFQKSIGLDLIVDSLQLSSVELDGGVTAKIIAKGETDVRAACSALTRGRSFTLEKIQLRFPNSMPGSVILTNSASATLAIDDPNEEIINALRNSIPQ